jgi:cytochrome c-type biogenesis protein
MPGLDLDTLRLAVEQASLYSLAIGLLAGLIFSVNPVAIAAIPVSLAYVSHAQQGARAIFYGAAFVAGMLVIHVALGVIAGLGGAWVQKLFGREWGLALGPLLIFLGLVWIGWIRLPWPRFSLRAREATSVWGAGGLGAAFSVAVCPFCTPALYVLLGVVAAIGSPLFGAVLMLAFALGRTIPVLAGAWAIGALKRFAPLARAQRAFDITGGVVLLLSGLYMLNAYFLVIPELAV